MLDKEIEDRVTQLLGSPRPPTPRTSVGRWAWDMYTWGRKVRRDILILEQHVAKLKGAKERDLFYGDPGDPPPPPDDL